ncbi:membrane protein insertion efficiency factor YidD [Tessaracoccus palaemonis]|uniref:Putative membrane protein insertion efficiency factor n=1 Tax=Tessaracoccus palaemonis TaxID=2829499 RepID=A0ABX8SL75_9ACTN|nr:membrane protein insertion efficiency factor YidD [Tessaracoccus palaemonis]QXT62913.1 membrane protein insertion efficiency factor YidD [Tessaracoccus palaemonis]
MLKYPLMWFVRGWRRFISPVYGDVCKFHPTCSAYGLRALEVHGALKGSAMTVARLLRCHPWSKGGVDYVPGTPEAVDWARQVSEESRGAEPRTNIEVA